MVKLLYACTVSECFSVDLKLLELETCTLRITRTVAVTIKKVLFVRITLALTEHCMLKLIMCTSKRAASSVTMVVLTQIKLFQVSIPIRTAVRGGAVDVVSANFTIMQDNSAK